MSPRHLLQLTHSAHLAYTGMTFSSIGSLGFFLHFPPGLPETQTNTRYQGSRSTQSGENTEPASLVIDSLTGLVSSPHLGTSIKDDRGEGEGGGRGVGSCLVPHNNQVN